MTEAKATKSLTAWREILAAGDDSIDLAETLTWLGQKHPEVEMPPRALLICHMTAMLAATLSVESVVNDILQTILREETGGKNWQAKWSEVERRPLKEKVEHISEAMGYASPLEQRPFVIIDEMLDFHERIVHAKPELVEVQHRVDDNGGPGLVSAWERACTMENAVRFRDAAHEIAFWFIKNSGGKFGPDVAMRAMG